MMETELTKTIEAGDDVQTCDLCIIGAGIAGLNALFVATEYLRKTDKVILIERRTGPGGMWADVYDYARLHQPHPSFTVGDMKWNLPKPKDYLASGAEVQSHLQRCYDLIRDRVDLVELFGHSLTACNEIVTDDGVSARVTCRDADGRRLIIDAKRVIKATGFDVHAAKPLLFSSSNVVSTTPERLSREAGFEIRSPVYIVGGGKTGMDTAYNLFTRSRGHTVNLINGKGTVFVERSKFFPSGARRWWSGTLLANLFRNQAMMFNGTNEDSCYYHLRRNSTVCVGGNSESFFYGVLSRHERDVIASGLESIVRDYLVDVVDGVDGPEMVLSSGARRPVPEGSVFINCTGHLLRRRHDYEPYISEGGAVLAITPRSMVHFLSTASAYLLTHLFFRDKLRDLPLYEFDGEEIISKNPRLYHMSLMCLTFMNQLIMMRALPLSIFNRCGLDIDRLYPLHRRAIALIDLKLNGENYVRHCMKALDRMRIIRGVRCGTLAVTGGRRMAKKNRIANDHRPSEEKVAKAA